MQKPEKLLESEDHEKFCDFLMQTNNQSIIGEILPSLTRKNKICQLIDPSCPSYSHFEKNKEERCTNSSNLKFEINWTWKIKKVEVILVIIDALGAVSKDFST